MQEPIKYKDVIELGFKREEIHDSQYLDQFGYDYATVTKNITKSLYFDWDIETRYATLVRLKNHKEGDIGNVLPITNLEHLKLLVKFFTENATR